MRLWADYILPCDAVVDAGSLDSREDGEHNDVDFVEMSQIFTLYYAIFF